MRKKHIFILVWIAAASTIFILSLLPNFGPPQAYNIDKFFHFGAYAFLGAISALSFRRKLPLIIAAIILIVIAFATEFFQQYVPGRQMSYGDATANISGIIAGIVAGHYFFRGRFN